MKTTIYHNPRCSKSRQALELLNNNNIDTLIIEYLKQALSEKQIKNLLVYLNNFSHKNSDENKNKITIRDIMRKKEKAYLDNNLGNPELSENELIKYVANNPILLERPIVVFDNKAVICRPPELVLELV